MLCKAVIDAMVQWNAVTLVLQCGGLEARGTARFVRAFEQLLKLKQSNLILIPEYKWMKKLIDIALVTRKSVGRSTIIVDTVIEIKSNFARQGLTPRGGEIGRQMLNGLNQAVTYRDATQAKHSYLLHLIASPNSDKPIPASPRDNGWNYWRSADDDLIDNDEDLETAIRMIRSQVCILGQQIAGDWQSQGNGHLFYCYVVKAPPEVIMYNREIV